jgi:hypothetical protein
MHIFKYIGILAYLGVGEPTLNFLQTLWTHRINVCCFSTKEEVTLLSCEFLMCKLYWCQLMQVPKIVSLYYDVDNMWSLCSWTVLCLITLRWSPENWYCYIKVHYTYARGVLLLRIINTCIFHFWITLTGLQLRIFLWQKFIFNFRQNIYYLNEFIILNSLLIPFFKYLKYLFSSSKFMCRDCFIAFLLHPPDLLNKVATETELTLLSWYVAS